MVQLHAQDPSYDVHPLLSFLFLRTRKGQGKVHRVKRGVDSTIQMLTGPYPLGAPTLAFDFRSISELFLWVNEDGSSQAQPHYVKELLTACSISLTFMVILKPKW